MTMRISNKVKYLMNLMKMLPSNYTFSQAHQGVIHSYINVFISDKNIKDVYIGEIFLYLEFVPNSKLKSKYVIVGMDNYHHSEFIQKILNEWASIGIHHRPCKEHPSDNVNTYYELWVENDN